MRSHFFGRRHSIVVASLLALSGAQIGCNSSGPGGPPSPGLVECGANNVFNRSDFSNPTRIDNRWSPLVPGNVFILDGRSNRGGGLLPHRVVFTVTDLVKEINGVDAVMLWDRDYNNGELQEAELAFFAQDDDGNVWLMGEYPEEYQGDIFIGAPSTWISGFSGADAGILVPGSSHLAEVYLQGWAPDVNFLDCGRAFAVGQSVCVPYNCFENVFVVDEWSPLEPASGHQRKYYAPGVGNVLIGAVDDPEAETLVLTSILRLSPEELAEARVEALRLEQRAYEINADYQRTQPSRLGSDRTRSVPAPSSGSVADPRVAQQP